MLSWIIIDQEVIPSQDLSALTQEEEDAIKELNEETDRLRLEQMEKDSMRIGELY